ncbi:unnamed protein product [Rhizophagus irregularis]|nr:unnamed protein product [Rhizophagus irregularis]
MLINILKKQQLILRPLALLRSKHTKSSEQIPTPFKRAPIVMHSRVQQIAAPKEGDKSTTAVRRNRYYEKPFLKRQRIKMEIEQKKFKDSVRKKVQLVLQMKARGM